MPKIIPGGKFELYSYDSSKPLEKNKEIFLEQDKFEREKIIERDFNEADQENIERQREQLTIKLGTILHDEWREPRRREDGGFDPRVKVLVKNLEGKEKWYNEGDSNIPADSKEIKRQDIANTKFEDLDEFWQADNKSAAEAAMNEVFRGVKMGFSLDDETFIEQSSAIIHDEWLSRNGWQATEIQKKPYGELPEDEKEKDRTQLIKAIELYKNFNKLS